LAARAATSNAALSPLLVAAECRVAAGGNHLEHTLREPQDRDVEGAAAQVVHRVDAFAGVIEAIGNRSGRRLADQAQHIEARQLRGILGGLSLAFVEIRGHGDDRAIELIVEGVFGAVAQRRQNFGADFDRRFFARERLHLHHAAVAAVDAVRHRFAVGDVGQPPAHETLDRGDGVGGVLPACRHGIEANLPAVAVQVAHHRRQQHAALVVGQAFGHAVAHRGHQRMRGAQVDAYGNTALMRIWRLAGF
jgi:hypothetical protein